MSGRPSGQRLLISVGEVPGSSHARDGIKDDCMVLQYTEPLILLQTEECVPASLAQLAAPPTVIRPHVQSPPGMATFFHGD